MVGVRRMSLSRGGSGKVGVTSKDLAGDAEAVDDQQDLESSVLNRYSNKWSFAAGMTDKHRSMLAAAMQKDERRIDHTAARLDGHPKLGTTFLALTSHALYLVDSTEDKPMRWDHLATYRIEPGDDPCVLVLTRFSKFELIAPTKLRMEEEDVVSLWAILIARAVRDVHQSTAESKFVGKDEVFQAQFPLYKTNRKGVDQERNLVLSNTHVYNVECKKWPFDHPSLKWKVELGSIKAIDSAEGSPEITIQVDEKGNKKHKDKYEFKCLDLKEKAELIHELRRCYQWDQGTEMA